jgi:hypothetical protein
VSHRSESQALAERLVRCLPAATFEMETLVQLAGIEATRDVPSAAVTCEGRPRLLLNPDFVAAHCARDEHLFLLVMHELWHVILAHTRLYPRATPAENVAFDAVINAGLCRQFPGPEYRGFFEALNPADAFPGCLLRPPEGWPQAPRIPRGVRGWPARTRGLLERLYPAAGQPDVPAPLYSEILALLKKRARRSKPTLLGDHGDPEQEATLVGRTDFGDVVRRVVAAWPPPPFPLGGRDLGRSVGSWLSALGPATADARRVFAEVLRRTLVPQRSGERRSHRTLVRAPSGLAPLPNLRDRQAPARRALGLPSLLQVQELLTPARAPDVPARAHVYLDVSGSMNAILPALLGLLLPHVAAGRAHVFQFSTVIAPLTLAALRSGQLRTTGGTDVNCVLAHALGTPHLRTVLLVTDGYVGQPHAKYKAGLRERGLRIHAVLPAESAWTRDLEPLARSITVLPGNVPSPRSNP